MPAHPPRTLAREVDRAQPLDVHAGIRANFASTLLHPTSMPATEIEIDTVLFDMDGVRRQHSHRPF